MTTETRHGPNLSWRYASTITHIQLRRNIIIYRTEQNRLLRTILKLLTCIGISFSQSATSSGNIEKSGDIIQALIPAIAYGSTFYLDDDEGRGQFYKSFFANVVITHGLKYAIDEKRPNGSDKSFPSGHTSSAFQGAAFIHKRYGWEYSIPAYIGASFVGYSRVESDNHYIKDVIAGAAIGVISSFYFTEPFKGVTVTPIAKKDYYGVTISKNW